MTITATPFADGYTYLEAPRWHRDRLWVSDFFSRRVLTFDLQGRAETVAEVEGMPGGLGFLPDGTPLVVSQMTHRVLRIGSGGALTVHADLTGVSVGAANEMLVDARGRAYVGSWGFLIGREPPRPTALALVGADGGVREAARDLVFPNGTVITPDGRTLIVAESFANRLTAFDVEEDGRLTNRRVWAQLEPAYTPDGLCLDAEGMIWAGNPLASAFIRVREGGEIVQRVPTPGRWAVACALGGPDRRTLFLLSAETSMEDQPRGISKGFIETLRVDAPGAGLP